MKRVLSFLIAISVVDAAFSQTIRTIKNSGGDYSTFSAAITFLNGAAAGPYIFNVDAGFTTTEMCTPITITWGSVSNYVIFQKSGSGINPVIKAGTGVGNSDAIVTINGGDYITFDGIDLQENTAATPTGNFVSAGTAIATAMTRFMEYGFYVINNGANGAQNNTIKNCSITLQNLNSVTGLSSYNSIAVYQNSNSGLNSGNIYQAITVVTAYRGIILTNSSGSDVGCKIQNCVIGSSGTIGSIGGTVQITSNAGQTYGIRADNQNGIEVSGNTVQCVQYYRTTNNGETIGIYLNGTSGTCNVYANNVNNVYNNYQSSNATNCAIGMHMTLASGTIYAYNNWVSKIAYTQSNGSASYAQTFGFRFSGSGSVHFYYNSIYLSDPAASNTAAVSTSGVSLYSVDNIFKNYSTTSPAANRYHYAVFFAGGTLSSSDYNIFDIRSNSGYSQYYAGNYGGTIPANNIASLATWQGSAPCVRDCNSKPTTVTFVSTTELHLKLTSCTDDVNFQGTQITTGGGYPLNITIDIDGDTRNWPYIGADEVNLLTPNVLIASNQPVQNTVSKTDLHQVVASFIVTPYGGSTTFTGFKFAAGSTTSPYGFLYAAGTNTDFKNFKLWVDSTGGTTFTTTAPVYQVGSTQNNTPNPVGDSLAFSSGSYLPLSLTGCRSYTFYVTFDVGTSGLSVPPNARSGANINSSFVLNNIGISSGTKYGTVAASGYQFIADKYYNYPGVDVTKEDSWYDATSAQQPFDFISPYQLFQMIAIPVDTMAKAWTVLGTSSKLMIGNGTDSLLFKADSTYTGTVDVLNKATLKFQTQSIPSTLGILYTGSTVEYGEQRVTPVYQNILAANYYNLKLSGSTSGIRVFPSGTAGVAGTFIPGSFTAASQGTVSFNGTVQQTIPSFSYYNLNIANTSGIALNTTTGTGACKVDNGSTIGVTGGTGALSYTAGNLCVNGVLSNLYTGGQVSGLSNAQLGFGSTGLYNFNGGGAANAYIPAATWNPASTAYLTGIYSLTGNGITHGGAGGTGKLGNLTLYDNSATTNTAKIFGSNWSNPTSVSLAGSLTLAIKTTNNPLQITTGSPTCTFNIDGDLNIYSGNYSFAHYAVTTNTTVLGNVNVDGSNVTYSNSNPTLTLASNNGSAVGNLNVAGNFYMKSGPYTASLVQSSGTANLKLNGSGAQQQLTFTTTSGIINLEMATGVNGAKLYSPVTLNGALRFTSGILTTDATNIPTLATTASIAGTPGNTTFVNGPMLRNTNAASEYEFPVGKIGAPTQYRSFSVVPTTTTGSTFSGEYFPSAYGNLTIVDPVMISVQTNEYWMANRTSGTDNGRIKINYVNPGNGNWSPTDPCNLCNVAVAHFNTTTNYWEFTNGAILTFSSTAPIEYTYYATNMAIYSKVLSSFSPFTGGFGWNFLLPVNLLSFSGANRNGVASLVWKTATERNISQYIIERSTDGSHYENAGALAAKNLQGQNEYGFDDRSVPGAGIVYYRLKIMGIDGQFKYSHVIALNFKKGNGMIQVFPNPVRNILFMTHDKAAPGASVTIYSAVGSKVAEYKVVAGAMQTTLNTAFLMPGMYSIRYESSGVMQTARFAKL